jgi:F420-non-reducing hydrogenase small subunit
MRKPRRSVCEECPRLRDARKVRRRRLARRSGRHCMLDDAVLCCGPATRAGCHALCLHAGAPCIGCRLPAPDGDVFERQVLRALAPRFSDPGRGIAEQLLEAGIPNVSAQLRAYHRSAPLLRLALERRGRSRDGGGGA